MFESCSIISNLLHQNTDYCNEHRMQTLGHILHILFRWHFRIALDTSDCVWTLSLTQSK